MNWRTEINYTACSLCSHRFSVWVTDLAGRKKHYKYYSVIELSCEKRWRAETKYCILSLFFFVSVLVKLSVSYTLASFVNKKDFDNLVDILMGRKKLPMRTLTNILQNPACYPLANWRRSKWSACMLETSDINFRLFLEKWKTHCIQLFGDNINSFINLLEEIC